MGINVVAMAEEDDVEKAIAMSLVDRPDGSPGSRQRKRNTKDWDVDASEARSESFSPDRGLMVKLAVPCLCLVFLWLVMSIRTVSPAHVGISVTFGAVSSATLSPGLHFVNPLASVTELNLKTQLLRTENVVPTQEGLTVELDVSLLYHLEPDKAREIFLTLGDSYEEILILPVPSTHSASYCAHSPSARSHAGLSQCTRSARFITAHSPTRLMNHFCC